MDTGGYTHTHMRINEINKVVRNQGVILDKLRQKDNSSPSYPLDPVDVEGLELALYI